jgi:hypothetical protein
MQTDLDVGKFGGLAGGKIMELISGCFYFLSALYSQVKS